MTTLVTGAAGFLGGHVAELLLAQGEPTAVLLRPGEDLGPLTGTSAEPRWGDIADGAVMTAALTGVEVVINCAARTGPWGPAAEYDQTNVRGLRPSCEPPWPPACGGSSTSVPSPCTETTCAAKRTRTRRCAEPNPYSRSKVAGEKLLQRMIRDEGAPVTIVRPGWIYGPRDTASFARFARDRSPPDDRHRLRAEPPPADLRR